MALLWVSTTRRPNELMRLHCVREEWDHDIRDEAGGPLPRGEQVVGDEEGKRLSYLHIPSSKYGRPAWIWIPQYTAPSIAR